MRWAVLARDGYHFAVPNKPWKQEATNIKTACGHFIVLPSGCEQRDTVDCDDCHSAVEKK